MKCDKAQENIVLMHYGELPDEFAVGLEQHLNSCEACRGEWEAMQALENTMALTPMVDPSPNLLAQARMRLDEALDTIPPHGILTRLRTHFFIWVGHVESAPALATLLLGAGFLAGNFTYRYEVAHAPKAKPTMTISHPADGVIANVTSIRQTPNSELVQVSYNKVVPETVEGSLDSPDIRELLLKGTHPAASSGVRTDSVSLLADECRAGHNCTDDTDPNGIRNALLVSMLYDNDATVRLRALEGLQTYVAKDLRVRDAIAEALSRDPSAAVRKAAIATLGPVRADSAVRQVLRTVSTTDENPYIRTASYNALQDSGDFQ
ncbi:HEAT repeat domain-containing protein [Edaphobacter sp.]|uniref:HEAT repeat domain-containing protein n=1 Tax=Edaphobacter sp. TaxID=1934404 RepID=UPI002DBB1664|nr:HEAT repeat domain-containing protein [Edaphobacter sp.]HEU5342424.1 HEAT repeat domain-containing protein [Edaphobacter sp.]